MIWSKYNFIYKSNKHLCNFLYNSRTNSFMSISDTLYDKLLMIKNGNASSSLLQSIDADAMQSLLKAKVFVSEFDDENFIIQKKYLQYARNFNRHALGIVIVPTYACNFKCPYCYESNLPTQIMGQDVEDNLIKFIESSSESQKLNLCWHGGEPLLAFDRMKSILEKIQASELIQMTHHAMVTNGYLLDDEKCNFLRTHNMDSIQITIDGLRDTHNQNRIHKSNIPTYDIILRNIERVFKLMPDCHVIVRVNIHHENRDDFSLLYEELTSRWGKQKYSIQMEYVDKLTDNCKINCLQKLDKLSFLQQLSTTNIKMKLYPSLTLGGCTATYANSFIVGPEGKIYKCWVDVGKKDRSVGSIFSNKIDISLLSEYVVGTDMYNDEKCLQCKLLPVCSGGCNLKRLNYKQHGTQYDICPMDSEKIDVLLDMYYDRKLVKTTVESINENV